MTFGNIGAGQLAEVKLGPSALKLKVKVNDNDKPKSA